MNLDILKTILEDFSTFWTNIGDFFKPLFNLLNGDDAFTGSSDVLHGLGSSNGTEGVEPTDPSVPTPPVETTPVDPTPVETTPIDPSPAETTSPAEPTAKPAA